MTYTALILSTALVTAGFAPFPSVASAQDATAPAVSQETPPTATVPASPAQLKREHDRAVKAGDAANDPFDSSSSDALNRQQLQAAQAALATLPTDSSTVLPPEQSVPANADVEAIAPDSPTPDASQPGTPDIVPPIPSTDTPDSVPPAPDSSPPATDDSLKPSSPIEPHSN